jgi:hypothetical protein
MSLSFQVSAMGHDLYMNILTGMFLFWNAARVLTYVPTIVRLVCAPTDARSHSLLTWAMLGAEQRDIRADAARTKRRRT